MRRRNQTWKSVIGLLVELNNEKLANKIYMWRKRMEVGHGAHMATGRSVMLHCSFSCSSLRWIIANRFQYMTESCSMSYISWIMIIRTSSFFFLFAVTENILSLLKFVFCCHQIAQNIGYCDEFIPLVIFIQIIRIKFWLN